MENSLVKVFENSEFGSVRTVTGDNGEVLFCGSDVAKALGYSNPWDAMKRHCDHLVKREVVTMTVNQYKTATGQTVELNFIPESDLYRFIIHSKLPSAKQFEKWVMEEVLPSIRKEGAYFTPELAKRIMHDPRILAEVFTRLADVQDENKRLTEQVSAQREDILHLEATNQGLSAERYTWKDTTVINSLVRLYTYGTSKERNPTSYDFARSWNIFYRNLRGAESIDLPMRRTLWANEHPDCKRPVLSFLKEDERGRAVSVAVAICEECGILTGVTLAHYRANEKRGFADGENKQEVS